MQVKFNFSQKWKSFKDKDCVVYYSSSQPLNFTVNDIKNLEDLEYKQIDYSIVIHYPNKKVQIITDRYGTIPVYYTLDDNMQISDYLERINIPKKLSKKAFQEHLSFDYIFSDYLTEFDNIYRVPSSISIRISADLKISTIATLKNIIPKTEDTKNISANEIFKNVDDALVATVSAYDNFYIPLSGGLDSRFVCAIAKKKANSIYCRTFGNKNSLDVKLGRKVAKVLDVSFNSVQKKDSESIAEFETLILESSGSVCGVHSHDIKGRNIFEKSDEIKAKVSGFIGDVLARGANMKTDFSTKQEASNHILNISTNIKSYDWEKLFSNNNHVNTIKQTINDFVQSSEKETGSLQHLYWDFYARKRIPKLVSLLEYFTHNKKPNIKPFLHPYALKQIAAMAKKDKWPGMNYVNLVKATHAEILKIPLASNSVFISKYQQFTFKFKKRIYTIFSNKIATLSKGKYLPLPYNATKNWRLILKNNPNWVNQNIDIVSNYFELNKTYLHKIYNEHNNGKKNHTDILLRLISYGVLINTLAENKN